MKLLRAIALLVVLVVLFCPHLASGQGWSPAGTRGGGGSGANGVNAYTTTTSSFVQPAMGASVTVPVQNASWMTAGQIVYVGTGVGGTYLTPAFVQLSDNDPGGAAVTTLSQAYGVNVTKGNTLIVALTFLNQGAVATPTISDSLNSVWQTAISKLTAGTVSDFPNGAGSFVFYAPVATTGADTVTINWNNAVQFPNLRITEYTNVSTFDVGAGNFTSGNGTGATVASTGNFTTNFPHELMVCANVCTGTSVSAGAGWTLRNLSPVTVDVFEEQIGASPGTFAGTVNVTSDGTLILAAGFRPTFGSSPGGYYTVQSTGSGTVTLVNLGYSSNASPGTTVLTSAGVSAGGLAGASGQNLSVTYQNFTAAAATQTLSCPSISKQRSGLVLVQAQASITAGTGVTSAKMNLQFDGATLTSGPEANATFAAAAAVQSESLSYVLSLPDTSPHTISALIAATGGSITIDSGGTSKRAQIVCQEL